MKKQNILIVVTLTVVIAATIALASTDMLQGRFSGIRFDASKISYTELDS